MATRRDPLETTMKDRLEGDIQKLFDNLNSLTPKSFDYGFFTESPNAEKFSDTYTVLQMRPSKGPTGQVPKIVATKLYLRDLRYFVKGMIEVASNGES